MLTELPDLLQVDEWEDFSPADFAAYREANMTGNSMAMRQAAYASGTPGTRPSSSPP